MNILINFITLIAWIWGGLAALGLLWNITTLPFSQEIGRFLKLVSALYCVLLGTLPWSWLVCRYYF